jgi:hypothetical protein
MPSGVGGDIQTADGRLVGSVRLLAFDRTLPAWEALGRIRDAYRDYDHSSQS